MHEAKRLLAPHNKRNAGKGIYQKSAQKWLKHEADLGINPFKYGFASGTDSHTSLSTAEEDNYWVNMLHLNLALSVGTKKH
ncbi:DUF3604 domain-containing protein [Aestuariibaculum sediminum]|uniref:DUF3604 domain-containing protein n=1 Tax=Aestuariibaculum sediminum TaxID=2770637 RepID=A0A8J6QAG4_9FLAO|nr:DUF3604 domain-containing protein [Aestuariibaculum sediminum]MBD0833442.1 DUF3604 domain-containing protein [Aestuariibaculum sediminum]